MTIEDLKEANAITGALESVEEQIGDGIDEGSYNYAVNPDAAAIIIEELRKVAARLRARLEHL